MKKQLSYIDSVHRSGTIWNISVMILLLAFLTVAALFGAAPDWGALVVGLIATAPMYWAVGVIETITFVPMLGAGGSYLSFVTGNISNLKLPAPSTLWSRTTSAPTPRRARSSPPSPSPPPPLSPPSLSSSASFSSSL